MPTSLSVQELKQMMDRKEAFRLIDVREEDEWNFCRLPGGEWHPMSGLPGKLPASLVDGEKVVVYCHHGMRSMRVGKWLEENGLGNIFNLAGGIDAWSKEIDPKVPVY